MQLWQILGLIVVDSTRQPEPNLLCVPVNDGKIGRRENVTFLAELLCYSFLFSMSLQTLKSPRIRPLAPFSPKSSRPSLT